MGYKLHTGTQTKHYGPEGLDNVLFWTIFDFGQFGQIYIESGLNVLNLCLFSELLDKIEPILGHICNSRATIGTEH